MNPEIHSLITGDIQLHEFLVFDSGRPRSTAYSFSFATLYKPSDTQGCILRDFRRGIPRFRSLLDRWGLVVLIFDWENWIPAGEKQFFLLLLSEILLLISNDWFYIIFQLSWSMVAWCGPRGVWAGRIVAGAGGAGAMSLTPLYCAEIAPRTKGLAAMPAFACRSLFLYYFLLLHFY